MRAPLRGTGPLPCKLARAAGRKFPLAPPASDADGSAAVRFFNNNFRDAGARHVGFGILNQIYRRAPVAHVHSVSCC